MLCLPSIGQIAELNPDLVVPHFGGKGLQIIALNVETATPFKVEASLVPIAGEDAVSNASACQWITHVRALVVSRIEFAVNVEQCDTPPFTYPHCLRFPPP